MNKPDDNELVARCQMGDRKAFEMLLVRYEKPVYNVAFRMLRSREDARDVAQTVFLKAYENLDRFDPAYRFFSWIYRIAMNESIDCLAKVTRAETLDMEPEDDCDSTEERIDSQQAGRLVQAALMGLKPDYRSVIVLKHFLDCSYTEISQILDVPENKVKSRLYAGRQLLKDVLMKGEPHQ
ncbi:MAG: RNA polymerase sigma factor [Woeseiaceae bacterium]